MLEWRVDQPGVVPAELLQSPEGLERPLVLRGLVAHWPLVQAAQQGDDALLTLLRQHWQGSTVGVFEMEAATRGRIGYTPDFRGFNFQRRLMPFGALLDGLAALRDQATPNYLYMGSTTVETCLPTLPDSHRLAFESAEPPLASLWLGNAITVPAHQDWPSNIACCISGRRRFTLYPPDCVADLYVGPLDLTPAGQPISLVEPEAPDCAERFPRYARAAARAQVVELLPGDAILIPSMWWHRVEALAPISGLINYWWRRSPAWSDTPMSALWLALATVRDLPPTERAAWRALFDHYVFDADAATAAHVPEAARGPLAPIDEDGMRRLRAWLINRLNR